jgi:hypothetical protein
MKQTAVEFLIEQLNEIGFHTILIEKTIQQAKEMEKEQIESAFDDGMYNEWMGDSTKPNEYYERTFKSE